MKKLRNGYNIVGLSQVMLYTLLCCRSCTDLLKLLDSGFWNHTLCSYRSQDVFRILYFRSSLTFEGVTLQIPLSLSRFSCHSNEHRLSDFPF